MEIPKKIQEIINDLNGTRDTIGKSGAGVYLYPDFVLKIQKESMEADNEITMLTWLNGKIPVPKIIEHIRENGYIYILMNKCTGNMACDPKFMTQPKKQAEQLAEALQMLWSVNTEGCPCQWPLQRRLNVALDNVIHNRVDIADAQPGTFGPGGFRNPESLLHWLQENQPTEKEVLSHGDFCLPNIHLSDQGVSGFLDLGRCGVSDPWQDIALCCRSLENNYNGVYDGVAYPNYQQQRLFDALQIKPDPERIRYYILLDELF